MRRIRVIPILLMKGDGLVKSVKFGRYKYVGDPINAVRIFNEKEVDEIVVLQIDATANGKAPDLQRIEDIASEAFMPLAYGGGITTLEQIRQILYHGAEKVVINSALNGDLGFIREAVRLFGQQSVVASVD
ncbi:MAG: HisA/HisF-related TIM barrel protein, partial [Bacteroidota bacterium]